MILFFRVELLISEVKLLASQIPEIYIRTVRLLKRQGRYDKLCT